MFFSFEPFLCVSLSIRLSFPILTNPSCANTHLDVNPLCSDQLFRRPIVQVFFSFLFFLFFLTVFLSSFQMFFFILYSVYVCALFFRSFRTSIRFSVLFFLYSEFQFCFYNFIIYYLFVLLRFSYKILSQLFFTYRIMLGTGTQNQSNAFSNFVGKRTNIGWKYCTVVRESDTNEIF